MVAFTDIIGIGLRIVSNRDKIAQAWDKIVPVVREVTKLYPGLKQLIDDVAPGVTTPDTPQQPSHPPALQSFSVQWLQEALNKLDDAGLEVDGDYGEMTREAVTKYQQAHSLVPDGWAGVDTQASIYQALQKHA